ncbi:MAG: hypothetical protein COA79_25030 [Planctomycetota bacterium]|nr:MAG: hypothetical protein COA79_25030 [Planctomycetota bacterium]
MTTDPYEHLDPSVLNAMDDVELMVKSVVNGYLSGIHKSLYQGSGLEFIQYRNYTQGDDLKFIDWKAAARTDKIYTKVFQEETNMDCHILLDCSASMEYGSKSNTNENTISKLQYMKIAASCLTYFIYKQGDKIGCTGFSDDIDHHIDASNKKEHLENILANISNSTAKGKGLSDKIEDFIASSLHNRGIVIMFSDCLHEENRVIDLLKLLSHSNYECILINLFHQDEVDFPFAGSKVFIDSETEDFIVTSPELIKEDYLKEFKTFQENIRSQCIQHKIEPLTISTKLNLGEVFNQYIRFRNGIYK